MNITRENTSDLTALLTVQVAPEDYKEAVDSKLKEYAKKANISGFRPGKVPVMLIRRMYGEQVTAEEVFALANKELYGYIEKENLDLLGEAIPTDANKSIDWKQQSFDILYEVGWAPDRNIQLDDKIKVCRYNIELTDKLREESVKNYTAKFGESVSVSEVGEGSLVYGELQELGDNGETKDDGIFNEKSIFLISTIKEDKREVFFGKKLEDVIVFSPHEIWDNKDEVAYVLGVSKEEGENITSSFSIKITDIKDHVKHPVNEDLFKKIYGEDTEIKTEEDFHRELEAEIKERMSSNTKYLLGEHIRAEILKQYPIELPEEFLKKWLLLSNEETTKEKIEESWSKTKEMFQWQLISRDILKYNDLTVSSEEMQKVALADARAQFAQYGIENPPQENLENFAQAILQDKQRVTGIQLRALDEKIVNYATDLISIEEKTVTEEEFSKIVEQS